MRTGSKIENPSTVLGGRRRITRATTFTIQLFVFNLNRAPYNYKWAPEIHVIAPGRRRRPPRTGVFSCSAPPCRVPTARQLSRHATRQTCHVVRRDHRRDLRGRFRD